MGRRSRGRRRCFVVSL